VSKSVRPVSFLLPFGLPMFYTVAQVAAEKSTSLNKTKAEKRVAEKARELEAIEAQKQAAQRELAKAAEAAKEAKVPVRRIAELAGFSVQGLYNLISGRDRGGRPGKRS